MKRSEDDLRIAFEAELEDLDKKLDKKELFINEL